MMRCPHCHREHPPSARYCPIDGHTLTLESPDSANRQPASRPPPPTHPPPVPRTVGTTVRPEAQTAPPAPRALRAVTPLMAPPSAFPEATPAPVPVVVRPKAAAILSPPTLAVVAGGAVLAAAIGLLGWYFGS